MIEDFYRMTLKKLKKQIFPPILRDDPNRFQMKLQREQYISFFFVIITIYLTDIFDFWIGIMRADIFIATTIVAAMLIHQLLKRRIKYLKV